MSTSNMINSVSSGFSSRFTYTILVFTLLSEIHWKITIEFLNLMIKPTV